ncbi:hypothetical protein NPIL_142541 [Nephila pilipes]|uniref:Uncharacterized protein n=1 Tax=Nephila pilipes TaxID=299642 RepID=A0A8X6MTA4_NEPPI|nr:hypothetical protein NPIL_142541 [Nephila pilipes]
MTSALEWASSDIPTSCGASGTDCIISRSPRRSSQAALCWDAKTLFLNVDHVPAPLHPSCSVRLGSVSIATEEMDSSLDSFQNPPMEFTQYCPFHSVGPL